MWYAASASAGTVSATRCTALSSFLLLHLERRRVILLSRSSFKRNFSSNSNSSSNKSPSPSAIPTSPGRIPSFSFANIVRDHPFVFQLLVATGKTAAADLIVQTVAERKTLANVDWKRNGIFVAFGFAYLGGFQYWLMVNKYRQWFPSMDRFARLPIREKIRDVAGILDAGKMVLFDLVIHLPVMYFPAYYTVKELVAGSTWNPIDWFRDGLTKYSHNWEEDLTAMVQLWGPSDCVQFVLPMHVRMPFRHIVSFFWTAYVSFTRGSIDPLIVSDTADVAANVVDNREGFLCEQEPQPQRVPAPAPAPASSRPSSPATNTT